MVGKNLATSLEKMRDLILQLDRLKRGDRVIVLWHDACRVTNDPDVRPEYYSTPKETQGTVYDCVPDPEYHDIFYLIISGETTSGRADYYDAIPAAWITKIQRLEAVKHPGKMVKVAAPSILVDRVIVYKNGKPHVDSGGVDKLSRKWVTSPHGATKMVEEITKVVAP